MNNIFTTLQFICNLPADMLEHIVSRLPGYTAQLHCPALTCTVLPNQPAVSAGESSDNTLDSADTPDGSTVNSSFDSRGQC